MFFTLSRRGAVILLAVGGLLAMLLVITQPEVTPNETQSLRRLSSNIITLYNQRAFNEIGEALVDDVSQGDRRINIMRKRTIWEGLLDALHEASGPCDTSLSNYEFGKYRSVPKFQVLLELECQKRPTKLLLTWGERSGTFHLIDMEIPNDYYSDVPEIKARLRDIYRAGSEAPK